MITLRTATGKTYQIAWIGISELNGSLRFEVVGDVNMFALISTFIQPTETATLTRVWDGNERAFEGFTEFKGVDKKFGDGGIVVALMRGD